MNKKLELKNFDLQSLKLNSKNQLSVDWFDISSPNDLLSVESDSFVHEDLVEKLRELKLVFADSLGLLDGWNFARENNIKNDEKIKEAMKLYNEEINRCNVTGFNLTENGIKIKGSLNCKDGKVSLSSTMIKFDDEQSEVVLDAKVIVDDLVTEVWRFIYQGKRQSDLFSQKEDKSGFGNSEEKHLKAV
jgi:hypothetical protein